MFEIQVLSRDAIEAVEKFDQPHAIISIKSPQGRWGEIKDSPNRKGILRLEFNDVEMDEFGQTMSMDQARKVLDFVRSLDSKIDLLICQCRAGHSRSSAVAAGIARMYGEDPQYYFNHHIYTPNRDVFNKMLRAIGEVIQQEAEKIHKAAGSLEKQGYTNEASAMYNTIMDMVNSREELKTLERPVRQYKY